MFRLNHEDAASFIIVIIEVTKCDLKWGRQAIEVNIGIVRTFVRLREVLASQAELARRVEKLEWHETE
jgi:hypothetical protein